MTFIDGTLDGLTALLVGAGAMALSDGTMRALGVTDPTEWAAADWAADALPHLAYGTVVAAALARRRI